MKRPRQPKPPDWSRKLARVIVLTNGKRIATLHDARAVVLDVFGSVNARSGGLDYAIERLLAAAETGKRADIAEATDAVEGALSLRRLL